MVIAHCLLPPIPAPPPRPHAGLAGLPNGTHLVRVLALATLLSFLAHHHCSHTALVVACRSGRPALGPAVPPVALASPQPSPWPRPRRRSRSDQVRGDFGVRLTALQLRRHWQWCQQHLCKPSLLYGVINMHYFISVTSIRHQSMCFPLANGRKEGKWDQCDSPRNYS